MPQVFSHHLTLFEFLVVCRLTMEASHPFLVVHANSAFMSSSGLSSSDVFGKPFGSFLDTGSKNLQLCDFSKYNVMDATVVSGNTPDKSGNVCRLTIKPIVPQNKDGILSHVLVQVNHNPHEYINATG
mmetsp:Transcript_19020/g.44314  ORF Transcript_19020/g.44314 Transcript_19020/m.44314 type:complete len:128 (-) Transcript_19020:386-769(-)